MYTSPHPFKLSAYHTKGLNQYSKLHPGLKKNIDLLIKTQTYSIAFLKLFAESMEKDFFNFQIFMDRDYFFRHFELFDIILKILDSAHLINLESNVNLNTKKESLLELKFHLDIFLAPYIYLASVQKRGYAKNLKYKKSLTLGDIWEYCIKEKFKEPAHTDSLTPFELLNSLEKNNTSDHQLAQIGLALLRKL